MLAEGWLREGGALKDDGSGKAFSPRAGARPDISENGHQMYFPSGGLHLSAVGLERTGVLAVPGPSSETSGQKMVGSWCLKTKNAIYSDSSLFST